MCSVPNAAAIPLYFFAYHITNMHRFPSNTCVAGFSTVHSNMHRVGGISACEMNRPELDLLFNLDFRLKVNLETFGSYCLQLEKHAAGSLERLPVQVHCVNG